MIFDKELIDKVSSITITDYEPYNTQREGKVLIDAEGIVCMIEDLLCEIEHIKEEFEDFKADVEDNYVHIPYERQI